MKKNTHVRSLRFVVFLLFYFATAFCCSLFFVLCFCFFFFCFSTIPFLSCTHSHTHTHSFTHYFVFVSMLEPASLIVCVFVLALFYFSPNCFLFQLFVLPLFTCYHFVREGDWSCIDRPTFAIGKRWWEKTHAHTFTQLGLIINKTNKKTPSLRLVIRKRTHTLALAHTFHHFIYPTNIHTRNETL